MSTETVLSIPAGDTGNLIHKYFLYVCPAYYRDKIGTNTFLSFRHRIKNLKGASDKIYRIEKVLEMNTSDTVRLDNINSSDLDLQEKQRLRRYFMDYQALPKKQIYQGEQLIIIVSSANIITLKNCPRQERNNTFWAYYTVEELQSYTVLPARQ
jgi:hypothetical protein